jgi:hypothetical protein
MIEAGGSRRWRLGRAPVSCSARAVGVVVARLGGEHPAEMMFVVDQESIGTFTPDGVDRAFGDRIRPGCTDRCPDHPGTSEVNTSSKTRVNFASLGSAAQVHDQIPGLLGDPRPSGSPWRQQRARFWWRAR